MPMKPVLLILSLTIFSAITFAENKFVKEDLRTSKLNFIFESTQISSLTYQLDCLADLIHCDREPIKQFWDTQNWNASDETAIKKWAQIQEKYTNVGGEVLETRERHPGKAGFPLRNNSISFDRKFRIASFISDEIKDYRKNLGLLMLPDDVNEAMEVIETFRARHEKWWQSYGYSQTKIFTEKFIKLLDEKDLFPLIEKVSNFCQASLSAKTPIFFHFFILPGKNNHSSGEQIEDHSVVEVLEGEEPIDRVDVILHELFHYLYRSAPFEQHEAFVKSFMDSEDPVKIEAYNLLNEVLATSLGNGIVSKQVLPSERFHAYAMKEKSFYSDFAIDKVAKILMPILEKDLGTKSTLYSPNFVPTYLKAVHEALGESAASPYLALRTHIAYYNPEFTNEYQLFARTIRAGAYWSSSSLSHYEHYETLKQSPHLSALLLLKPTDFPLSEKWNSMLGTKHIKNISKQLKKKTSFIYTLDRTPGSWIFLIVASQKQEAKHLLSKIEGAKSILDVKQ